MNLLSRLALAHHLAEEVHELVAGVAGRRFAVNLAGLYVERGIQRESAVSIVFKPMAFDASR